MSSLPALPSDPALVALAATKQMIKGIGPWAFARFCRNNGVKLEQCYALMFGKPPRFPTSPS